jgi:hypothetical protein
MKRARSEGADATDAGNSVALMDVVLQGNICPPSLHEVDSMLRSQLHFSCAAFTTAPIAGCVAGYSLKGGVTFPLLPLADSAQPSPQRWCCDPREGPLMPLMPPHVNCFGLLMFRSGLPPTFRQGSQPVAHNLLPQSLRSMLPTCIEIPLTERAFGAVWASESTVVATVPCEERLVVISDVRLDKISSRTQPALAYHPMPAGVVPLAITSSNCSGLIWLCVSSLHDGIFIFQLADNASLRLQHQISANGGRSPFRPAVRLVAFRLASNDERLGHPLPPMDHSELCLAAVSPYDERMLIYHVVSGRHVELEHTVEFAPLAVSCAEESLIMCQALGSITHATLFDRAGGILLQKCSRFGAPSVAESPMLLTNSLVRTKKSTFRRNLMCALTADGWVGIVERGTTGMRGFRWVSGQRVAALEQVGAAFAFLMPDVSSHSESYDALILSRAGAFTVLRIQL